jgi:hypothetical protein
MPVFPSPEIETELPCSAARGPMAPVPTSLACWLHTPRRERVYTHAAPAALLSKFPPTMAVFPSPEIETESPCCALPMAPVPTSLACWLHTPCERVYTHAAPAILLSRGPPTMAVFPSLEIETESPCATPCSALPMAPVPTSLACWLNCPCAGAGSVLHTGMTTGRTQRTRCRNFIISGLPRTSRPFFEKPL